jgi:hypothetical protein
MGGAAHQRHLLSVATALFEHGKITTTRPGRVGCGRMPSG